MGVFLTAGYVFQTLGLEHTSASNAGFITGLFVVLTPLFGLLLFRIPVGAGRVGRGGRVGARPVPAVGRRRRRIAARRRARVPVRLRVRGPHPRDRAGGARATTSARWSPCSSTFCGVVLPGWSRRSPGDLEAPRGRDRLERAARHVAGRERARVPGPELCAAHDLVRAHGADPRRRAGIRRAVRLPAAGRPASAAGWTGAALILVAIVAVDAVPRLRPPRPLPEG